MRRPVQNATDGQLQRMTTLTEELGQAVSGIKEGKERIRELHQRLETEHTRLAAEHELKIDTLVSTGSSRLEAQLETCTEALQDWNQFVEAERRRAEEAGSRIRELVAQGHRLLGEIREEAERGRTATAEVRAFIEKHGRSQEERTQSLEQRCQRIEARDEDRGTRLDGIDSRIEPLAATLRTLQEQVTSIGDTLRRLEQSQEREALAARDLRSDAERLARVVDEEITTARQARRTTRLWLAILTVGLVLALVAGRF